MLRLALKQNVQMFTTVKSLLNNFVEVKSFLSSSNLYGEVVEVDDMCVTIRIAHDDNNADYSETTELYLPLNSIISIRAI